MSAGTLRAAEAFAALVDIAARLGCDPLQVQGPGGNVSIKAGGEMLVKASGTWLADAEKQDIFAHVDAAALRSALLSGDPSAEHPERFLASEGLRPSIETSFHAALDAPVVLHTHCVATIARSTRPLSTTDLDALRLVSVPYAKPGADLARSVVEAWHPGARGAILCNHGLIATGDTVAEAAAVIAATSRRFETGEIMERDPDPALAADLAPLGWDPLGRSATTALSFDTARRALADGAALYPDQVIFLGPSPIVVRSVADLAGREPSGLALIEGRGAALPRGATPAAIALARSLGEVVFRLSPDAQPTRLTSDEARDLLGWDAETYRQRLEADRTAALRGAT